MLGITVISFILSQALPADPTTLNLGKQAAADPEVVAAFRKEWGLDKPPVEQYLRYLWNLLHGNMGISITSRRPVIEDLGRAIPATVELTAMSMVVSILFGIPLGILAAVKTRHHYRPDQPGLLPGRRICACVLAGLGRANRVLWLARLGPGTRPNQSGDP